MATIVDQFGRPVYIARKFAHAADQNRARGPQFCDTDKSIDDLIPKADRRQLVALSKRLFVNMGAPMRAAIAQKADYSVGCAWFPVYYGADKEVGQEVCGWLKNVFYPLADVRGGVHDWHRLLTLVSIALDRDGEAFVMLTKSKDETFPRVQHIPSYMVCSCASERIVKDGPYKGMKIHDGIITNAQGAAVAYRIHTSPQDKEDISARDLIHVYDPTFQDQGRGLPAFTHALDDMKNMLQSTEYERIKQQVISSILLVEKNENGGPDFDDPMLTLSKDTTDGTGIASEQYGPAVHYFKANSGEGLETVTHDSPGDVWESFHDRMIRSALAPLWSYSLVWKPMGQGTAERNEVEKARRFVEARKKTLRIIAKRVITYAVGVGVENDRIPQPENMLAWDFTMPPRLTVDDGREARSQNESHEKGHLNETTIQGWSGRTAQEHWRERANEEYDRQLIRLEVMEERNATTGREIAIPAEAMGIATTSTAPPMQEQEEDDDETTPTPPQPEDQ